MDNATKTITLGSKIRKLRKARKISLDKLSKCSGVSKAYLWGLENERNTNPTLPILQRIATSLDITLGYLINEEQEDESMDDSDKVFLRNYKNQSFIVKRQLLEILKILHKARRQM